jgi:nucleoside-diphosphate-sugar epimerase
MRVLVTGATGFVGYSLCEILARSGFVIRAALRKDLQVPASISEKTVVGDITGTTDWRAALRGVDLVLHMAATVHVFDDPRVDLDRYIETNARGTEQLAIASAQAGIRRFQYLSSVKVLGETSGDRAYTEKDEPRPHDDYGKSKWLAEKYLTNIASQTGMEAVIVRSPLVYGPRVRANFLSLLHWIDREWPLPLGAIENNRSLVSVWNLCDLLVRLLQHPNAPGHSWMVSDGEDVSTPELIQRIAKAMNRHARLVPIPVGLLRLVGDLSGRRAEVMRLCDSLTVSIERTCRELDWHPPIKLDEALARTIAWYRSEGRLRNE